MARSLRTLMLATTFLVVAGVRAVAQYEPPSPAYPDPSAILLPPVASGGTPVRSVRPSADLPSQTSDDNPRPSRPRSTRRDYNDEPVRPIAPIRSNGDDDRPRVETAALLRAPADSTTLRAADYEAARREPSDDRSRKEEDPDAYDYLLGRARRGNYDDHYSRGPVDLRDARRKSEQAPGDTMSDTIDDVLGGVGGRKGRGERFRSDHRFDCFIAPTTNPFYFEDARTTTEIRPIFIYQNIPNGNANFNGGGAWFLGGQARLAITDRFSIVMNKLGASNFSPGSGSLQNSNTGLSELWIGPKFGLIQNPDTKTLVTAGTTFQIPLGSSSVYQNTGNLSIVPYLSAAQELINTDLGAVNGMASTGWAISVNNERSNMFYLSSHVDLNFKNNNRFYPFLEANWSWYTKSGNSTDLGVEGRDLANFGAVRSQGSNLVTLAVGSRFKITKAWDVGGSFEFPLFGSRDLFRYRASFDIIWRY